MGTKLSDTAERVAERVFLLSAVHMLVLGCTTAKAQKLLIHDDSGGKKNKKKTKNRTNRLETRQCECVWREGGVVPFKFLLGVEVSSC